MNSALLFYTIFIRNKSVDNRLLSMFLCHKVYIFYCFSGCKTGLIPNMSTSGSQTKTGSHIMTRSKARKNASKATGSDAIMTGGPHPTHQGHPSRVNMQQKNTSGPITRSRSLLQ